MSMVDSNRPMGSVRSVANIRPNEDQPYTNAPKKKVEENKTFKSKITKAFYEAVTWIKNNRIYFYRVIALAGLFGMAWGVYWLALNYTIWGALISFGLSGTETIVTP